MNRRSLFKFLGAAAGAVGLGRKTGGEITSPPPEVTGIGVSKWGRLEGNWDQTWEVKSFTGCSYVKVGDRLYFHSLDGALWAQDPGQPCFQVQS